MLTRDKWISEQSILPGIKRVDSSNKQHSKMFMHLQNNRAANAMKQKLMKGEK